MATQSITFRVTGVPVAKARPRAGRYGFYTPKKTATYEDLVGWEARLEAGSMVPITGPVAVCVAFTMPIPASWSKKRQNEAMGKPHTSKPDIDNMCKAIGDACNGVIWEDDSQIWHLVVTKTYGAEVGAVVTVTW